MKPVDLGLVWEVTIYRLTYWVGASFQSRKSHDIHAFSLVELIANS